MTSLRMALSELRRLTGGRLPRLAVAALVLVPTIYAGLYLWANLDPYEHLDQVPAALVVEDEGAVLADGSRLHAGREVADDLLDRGDFDWREVSEDEAAAGVEDGTYDFSLRIPHGFSASLASNADLDPHRARLSLLTNDANSYLATTIANTVVDHVREALARQVGSEAATSFLTGLADIRAQLVPARDGAGDLHDGAVRATDGAARLADGAGELSDGAGRLAAGLQSAVDRTRTLPEDTRRLAEGSQQVADGNARVAEVGDEVASRSRSLVAAHRTTRDRLRERMVEEDLTPAQRRAVLEVYDELGGTIVEGDHRIQAASGTLDDLADGSQQVADGNQQLAAAVPALVAGLADARDGAVRLDDGAGRLTTGAEGLGSGLRRLSRGTDDLHRGLASGVRQVPDVDADTRERLAETLGDPVDVASQSDATAASYGAGLAPFFLSLAAWIGGYVLFLVVRPLSPRALAANQNPLRTAVGGWLAPAALGVAQVVVASVVVFAVLGIDAGNQPGTIAFLTLTSVVFVAIVHALSAWFGKPGQFLGLVLMVLQLITAGGTFPWQTLPSALHPLHHALPMSYAVDGLRQLMYGGLDVRVLHDVLVLLGWLVAALAATSWAARRQRVWSLRVVHPELSM